MPVSSPAVTSSAASQAGAVHDESGRAKSGFEILRRLGGFADDTLTSILSVLTLVGVWYAGSFSLSEQVLPAPHLVVPVLYNAMLSSQIWLDIGITLWRILIAFTIAMTISAVLGFAMGLSHRASVFFRVWVVCFITIPALVIMLTCYMVVGLNDKA